LNVISKNVIYKLDTTDLPSSPTGDMLTADLEIVTPLSTDLLFSCGTPKKLRRPLVLVWNSEETPTCSRVELRRNSEEAVGRLKHRRTNFFTHLWISHTDVAFDTNREFARSPVVID
jgi:hypothetical protein